MKTFYGILAIVGISLAVRYVFFTGNEGKRLQKKLLKKGYKYQKALQEIVETGKDELGKITDDIVHFTEREKKKAKKLINI
ncbi:MAG: hypothetical protein ACM3N9_00520 [Syntrophothermus sp.]